MRFLLLLALALLFVQSAAALGAKDVEGMYRNINPPLPTANPDKVEVLEVFWYRCPHCNRFQSYVKAYEKEMPDYVDFRRMPAVLRDNWIPQAKMYFTAEALGVLEDLHPLIFNAIHSERRPMSKLADIKAFFVENGVDAVKFDATWHSFHTDAAVRQADAQTRRYGITGVPTVIINGRYRTSGQVAGSYDAVLEVIRALVEEERSRISK
ncbi:MAG: thiol:disulfide interchange protein DsbA/DsbL [Pseudomonadota bacterium]